MGQRDDLFRAAQDIADTVLYEGYVLYPYRASDPKNQMRFQWGVLVPPAYAAAEPSERAWSRTDCLVEGPRAHLTVRIRFLQVVRRSVRSGSGADEREVQRLDVDDATYQPWDEARDHTVDIDIDLGALRDAPHGTEFTVGRGSEHEELRTAAGAAVGSLVRDRAAMSGRVEIDATTMPGPYGTARVRIRVENTTPWTEVADRPSALRGAFVGTHVLAHVTDGRFVSVLDPPEWAKPFADRCESVGTFPVLAGAHGRRDLVLSSPIILYDHPAVAAQSAASFMDATEIDELLSLRTLTLTDDEKREARGTDPRARELIDHVDDLPPELMDRLHGALRFLDPPRRAAASPDEPWWTPSADAAFSPETDSVVVAGVELRQGSSVRLRPGTKRADAQDMFLIGRPATVAAVLFDVDGDQHLAVTLDEDPDAAELQQAHGRFLYFAPDEVEPA